MHVIKKSGTGNGLVTRYIRMKNVQVMQWNPLIHQGRIEGGPCIAWRRTNENESGQLGKSQMELEHISRNRIAYRHGRWPKIRKGLLMYPVLTR